MHPENLTEILRQHPFLAGLSEEHMETLIGCASNMRYDEGAYLTREGELANKFFLLRSGRVALEVNVAGRGALRIQTVGEGEVLGWSWLLSPFRWHFSGCAVMDVRAVALDGECLRNKCETDPLFGYQILKRFSLVMESRLQATRMQLLDLYATKEDQV